MITLRNDFHRTSARIRAQPGERLTSSQWKRAERALCGMSDCCCGTIRGPQWMDDGTPLHVDGWGSHQPPVIWIGEEEW